MDINELLNEISKDYKKATTIRNHQDVAYILDSLIEEYAHHNLAHSSDVAQNRNDAVKMFVACLQGYQHTHVVQNNYVLRYEKTD